MFFDGAGCGVVLGGFGARFSLFIESNEGRPGRTDGVGGGVDLSNV